MTTPQGRPAPALPAPSADVTVGLLLMVTAVLIAPFIDIFSKLATETTSPMQITAVRFFFQMVFMLPIFVWRRTVPRFSRTNTHFHVARGGLIALSVVCYVTALSVMSVADAVAIFFIEPIILTVLSSIFLKETIGWRRYTACAVGFGGSLLIIQPSFEQVGFIALLPAVSALCVAVFAILTRKLAHREDPWSMQIETGFWGMLISLAAIGLFGWSAPAIFAASLPDVTSMAWMTCVGLAAAISGIFSVYAYRTAPASTLAPLQYLEIVTTTIFGWLVFRDFPDPIKWLGIAIIIGSGLFIIWRERRFTSKPVSDNATLAP
ncbi:MULTISPECIES: DMT family transporter [Alphaproteobacteria]|uniref:Membrane protein n=2 Tax=Alphaproteobacteria TaxID=28211 RepID=A0A512HED7_9HYPH|nr:MULTISPECIES: DMT family transporter [Alphaproteobacteria]GEO83823.1 membrane protein [Ciceribacter naphthalenivorans]GLR21299.1 membrane protein [Ciceribacter naphthalenivorans]GLT04155.1 membrane protein [Sphingomonas psychrolutea]